MDGPVLRHPPRQPPHFLPFPPPCAISRWGDVPSRPRLQTVDRRGKSNKNEWSWVTHLPHPACSRSAASACRSRREWIRRKGLAGRPRRVPDAAGATALLTGRTGQHLHATLCSRLKADDSHPVRTWNPARPAGDGLRGKPGGSAIDRRWGGRSEQKPRLKSNQRPRQST